MTLQKICILGAGTLGSRVALQSAISGFTVTIFDLKQASLDSALLTMQKILRQLVRAGTLPNHKYQQFSNGYSLPWTLARH